MKITLITVGKTAFPFIEEGIMVYQKMLAHYCAFTRNEIPELKGVSALTKEQIKEREGELILKNIKEQDNVVLLDERGTHFDSEGWAEELRKREIYGGRDMVFVIGGAYGFSQGVYKRANQMLSLSKMTFSHQIIRLIFMEQLYRAFTIIRGEPYHHK